MPNKPNPLETHRNRLDLRSLLGYQNPRMEEYRLAVGDIKTQEYWPTTNPSFCDAEMTWLAKPENKRLLDLFRSKLNGIVVDLGSGTNSLGMNLDDLGIDYSEIIGVDPHRYNDYLNGEGTKEETRPIDPVTGEVLDQEQILLKPKLHEVREDALLFTARLKRQSVNFAIFGPTVMHYPWKELMQEIVEATKSDGIIFGGTKGIPDSKFETLAEDFPTQIRKVGKSNLGLYIFEKVK